MPTKLSDFRVRTREALALRTGFFLIALVITAMSFLQRAEAAPQTPRDAPISLFKLPTFNTEGFRTSLLRGTEARYVNQHQIDLSEMNLTLFFGDGTDRVD